MQALQRLRLPAWPYAGAVALVEEDALNARRELHVIDRWRYLGSALEPHEAEDWLSSRTPLPRFDVDIFRQLQRALGQGAYRVHEFSGAPR
jgi:DNA polymerase-3 subunit epsilon